jgi:hypothetical protein
MARIRSTHPNQWTDEAFVSVSAHARLLALGLRNEADDYGVFKWKPLTLKMRILPADNIDAGTLLGELENADIVRKFQADGETYGAIRNFCRYQRPKKPLHYHPFPEDVRVYVGTSSEPVPNQSPTAPEKPAQRETYTETKTEQSAPTALRGSRFSIEVIPDDWKQFCISERKDLDPTETFKRFADYWKAKPGKDGRKTDWEATWRNWVRNERGRPGGPAPPPSVDLPAGMRHAKSTAEYVAYMREKTGDPKLENGDWRLSKWQWVPKDWSPNVVQMTKRTA